MKITEFYQIVLHSEDTVWEMYDIRPFAERQGEALDCFLHKIETEVNGGTFSVSKPICVLHDSRIVFLFSSVEWIKHLKAVGVPLNFKEAETDF